MGSPTLKKKIELNYRRGSAAHSCSECNHYGHLAKMREGELVDIEPRCSIMGYQSGRAYRINPNNICDKHDNSEALKMLGGSACPQTTS